VNYVNRQLLDLARLIPCTLRRLGCTTFPTGPLHSNHQRHGKGRSIKAHDCFHAAGCARCHEWLDVGQATREEKAEVFQRAMEETWLEYWRRGLVSVVKGEKRPPKEATPSAKILPRDKPW
jgi:hypothetical protein